jgi:hypothetical protein
MLFEKISQNKKSVALLERFFPTKTQMSQVARLTKANAEGLEAGSHVENNGNGDSRSSKGRNC